LIAAAWLSVIFAVSLAAQESLLPGKPLERTIAGGQTHIYRIPLQAGQFVQADWRALGLGVTKAHGERIPALPKELMQEFYRLREANNALKSEALRQAPRKLLRGELVSTLALTQREIVHETNQTANLPKFKPDPKAPYAHPYYWALFILIGNWK
jgi:hypothetical protein